MLAFLAVLGLEAIGMNELWFQPQEAQSLVRSFQTHKVSVTNDTGEESAAFHRPALSSMAVTSQI